MAYKSSSENPSEAPEANESKEYDASCGKSPLEWLEINEGITYSQLKRISGERKFLNLLAANPVIALGLTSGLFAIGGGLYSIRKGSAIMSNRFLRLRVASSATVFGFVVYKIWDQIDWHPPAVQKLQRYIKYAFKKDVGLLADDVPTNPSAALSSVKKSI